MEIQQKQFSVKGLSVFVAVPNYTGYVPIEHMVAMLSTQQRLNELQIPIEFIFERGNALIDSARNNLVARFLKESKCNRLFFIDDDIVWDVEDFIRLLALSTVLPSVSATYTCRNDNPHQFLINVGEEGKIEWNEYGLMRIDGAGLGFSCFDRKILQELADVSEKYTTDKGEVSRIFKIGLDEKGRYSGEDISFFKGLKKLGHETWLDIDITLSHVGVKHYTMNPRKALQQTNAI